MYRRADKIPEGWLAKERRLAAQRARNDEIAKLRLAEAWNRLYDEREQLIEMLRLCEAHCSDGYVAQQARDLLRRFDGPGGADA